MKNLSLLIMSLALSASAFSQQALWGGQEIISPEIHPDNKVTFRLSAPEAVKVVITGDFLPMQKITTPMGETDAPGNAVLLKNDNGVWEYTTPEPLASELYSYSFIIDGVKVTDPGNVYMSRDIASVTSIFIIGGRIGDLYKVNDVPHGTVARTWYDSPSLGMSRRVTVYTPPGYETSEESFPVFYLLHGAGGDEEAWIELGRASQILDNMIAQGKAKPMIVVMTNGNAGQQAAPGESPRGLYKPSFMGDTRMDGAFEESFPEIVAFVERYYLAKTEKADRAIAGLSMGGFHSMHISKQYPEMFDYVGLFSAAILPPQGDIKSNVYDNMDDKLKVQFSQNPKLYWIAIGNTDFLFNNNTDYRKMLDEKGYKYIYRESGEGHIWKNWRIYLTEFLPMIFKD